GLAESQVPRAGTTAQRAHAAQVLRRLIEQIGASKVHGSGSSRLTFMDQEAPRSLGNSPAVRVLMPVAPSSVRGRQSVSGPREGRKTARAIALLQRKYGATRAEIG